MLPPTASHAQWPANISFRLYRPPADLKPISCWLILTARKEAGSAKTAVSVDEKFMSNNFQLEELQKDALDVKAMSSLSRGEVLLTQYRLTNGRWMPDTSLPVSMLPTYPFTYSFNIFFAFLCHLLMLPVPSLAASVSLGFYKHPLLPLHFRWELRASNSTPSLGFPPSQEQSSRTVLKGTV